MVKKNASVAKKVNTMNQSFRTPNEITNSHPIKSNKKFVL